MIRLRRPTASSLLLIVLCLSGCSRLETEYGRSVGTAGMKSLNGFGVFREVYRLEGWEPRTVARLSERLNNVDAIVWTPIVETPPQQEVIDWFEEWFARGDKTLVYVLRDYQTEAAYWRQAAQRAPAEQRMEYRRRVARAHLEYLRELLSRPSIVANGWFTTEAADPPAPVGRTSGPWAAEVGSFGATAHVEYQVREFDADNDPTAAGQVSMPTFFPGFWNPGLSTADVEFSTLLAGESGAPLVAQVTASPGNDSKILVVAGGSLVNNFGLVDPARRRLAVQLVEASRPGDAPGVVGFLYSDYSGVSLSSIDPSEMTPGGLEMLTVWPLNLVTIHAAILGLIVCLMLLPIFGRPRRLPPRETSDFAIHIDAVATLMARTGDQQYARERIHQYMTRVRGETEGPWVLAEKPAVNPPAQTDAAQQTATQQSEGPHVR